MSTPHDQYRTLEFGADGQATRTALRRWWQRISGQAAGRSERAGPSLSSARAVLRRATDPDAALLTEGFRMLWLTLPESRRMDRDLPAWACVALVLSDVREDVPDTPFASALGTERVRGARMPVVSELRFQRALRCADSAELARRLRRLVHLIDRKANILSLADGILQWHLEARGVVAARADQRLAVRWAGRYFEQLARYQTASN